MLTGIRKVASPIAQMFQVHVFTWYFLCGTLLDVSAPWRGLSSSLGHLVSVCLVCRALLAGRVSVHRAICSSILGY